MYEKCMILQRFFFILIFIFVIDPYVHFYTYCMGWCYWLIYFRVQSCYWLLKISCNVKLSLLSATSNSPPPFRTCGSFNTNKSTTH